jgi:peptide/nickel transport system ATP-binding protein
MIEVNDLTVTFRSGRQPIYAVRGVSFAVADGETFGIVGESGSGKSTVLKAIAGLVPTAAPGLKINGQPLGTKRSKADRRLMQFVFQDPYGSLHPRQTVDDILREPLLIHGVDGIDEKVSAGLADVGLLPQHRFRYPHQLSGGQRQRVAIARALILKPRILLLDEPTSALDVSIQAEILNLVSRLRRSYQLTSILVSHDLSVVAHLCNRIAIMQQGRLVELLDVEALRRSEAKDPYTQELIAASRGFTRAAG